MTRNDLSLALVLSSFTLFVYRSDIFTLSSLLIAVSAHVLLNLVPYALDTKADALREELSAMLAKQSADIETLKSKVEMLTLGRAGR